MRMRRCSPVALAVLIGISFGHARCDAAPQDTNPGSDNVIRSTVREVLLDRLTPGEQDLLARALSRVVADD